MYGNILILNFYLIYSLLEFRKSMKEKQSYLVLLLAMTSICIKWLAKNIINV